MGVNITFAHDFKAGHPELLVSWELNRIINLLPRALISQIPIPGWYQHHHVLPREWLKLPAPLAENSGLKQLSSLWVFSVWSHRSHLHSALPWEAAMGGLHQSRTPLPSGCCLGLANGGSMRAGTGWRKEFLHVYSQAPSSVDRMIAVAIFFGVSPLLPRDLMVRTPH